MVIEKLFNSTFLVSVFIVPDERLIRLKLNKISKSQETIFAIFKRCDYASLYEN